MKKVRKNKKSKAASRMHKTREHNAQLKEFFVQQGLQLCDIWRETPDDLELENRQLLNLSQWVCLYGACPDRAKLEARGFLYPPVDPGFDPDSDWLRFERWMKGEPLTWTLLSRGTECDRRISARRTGSASAGTPVVRHSKKSLRCCGREKHNSFNRMRGMVRGLFSETLV